MTKELALLMYLGFVAWLLYRDRRLRPMTSWASWIPLIWIMIIGSRSISGWLGVHMTTINPDQVVPADYVEGSPLDRNVFIFLIVCGLIVLWKRRVNWLKILSANRWLFVFFLYCGVSILWSDFSFVSLKRWIKDLGNVVMVLVLVTEHDPVRALKAIFARYTYFAIPLCVIVIKYFPDIGRYYHRFTFAPTYCGIATNKNELGIILMVSGLILVWDLIERGLTAARKDTVDLWVRVALLAMIVWLIQKASSATATVSLMIGTMLLLSCRFRSVKIQVRKYLGIYSLAIALLLFTLYSFPFITEAIVAMVGRDVTLTGRTRIWADLLSQPLNPVLGTGYKSFWMGPAMERLEINQAHNGYLETYLNGGLIGLCLLLTAIVSIGGKLKKELLVPDNFETFRFSFFIVALFYNFTEAMFNNLSLIWFVLLVAALYYPALPSPVQAFRAGAKRPSRTGLRMQPSSARS